MRVSVPNTRTMSLSRNRRHPTPEVPANPAYRIGERIVMAVEQRISSVPTEAAVPTIESGTVRPTGPAVVKDGIAASSPPPTRISATWFGVCAAALTLVVLIVFMLQNTRSVEVSFLWLHGNVPLALALLIASVGTAVVVMVVGAARITQLRRHSRRPR